ncbi:cation-dependent mannose-6-phosphate receptor [Acrasis kona]|uniref:Cation-dependent mannose-6-phosphate receptor n=1 Tax=Acrasis kona TaxID=1008807 RepID=A0AAW2Z302_9EUKA
MKVILFSILLLVVAFVDVASASCSIDTPEGTINTELAASSKGSYYNKFWDVYVNVCKPVTKFNSGTAEPAIKGASGYELDNASNTLIPLSPSSLDDVKVELTDPNDPKGGVTLTYPKVHVDDDYDGHDSTLIFKLTCDEKLSDEIDEENMKVEKDYKGYPNFDVIITASTKGVCPRAGSSGKPIGELGVGGLLVVLLLAALVLYFIIGALVLKFKFQKTGVEIIPQVDFWKDVPFLIKDGCLFIYEGIMMLVNKIRGKPATPYENV